MVSPENVATPSRNERVATIADARHAFGAGDLSRVSSLIESLLAPANGG
jgi:hypothetical protein